MFYLAALSGVLGLVAQSYDATSAAADATSAGLGVGMMVLWCCLAIVGLVGIAFEIWMLIDVLKRSDAEEPNKIMWVLIILLTSYIGSLVYFFVERKKFKAPKQATVVDSTPKVK